MKQTLTVTTKGEVYWSVDVDDAEDSRMAHTEAEDFQVMEQRAQRLRKTLADPHDDKNQQGRRVGEIIR